MAVFLANIPVAVLIGFLAWLGVNVFGEFRVLGWFLMSLAASVLVFNGLYETRKAKENG